MMVDREKVIERLGRVSYYFKSLLAIGWQGNGDIYRKHMESVNMALKLLKEQGWNVLTEDDDGIIHGLPGDDGQYLMTDGKDIWIDEYVDGVEDGIILESGRDIREIRAWTYMPEMPKN